MNKIGIVGAGHMGKTIALEFARFGFPTILFSYERKLSHDQLEIEVNELIDSVYSEFKEIIIKYLHVSDKIGDLNKCAFVIETLKEDINHKRSVIMEIKEHIPHDSIIASNTSSLSIEELFKDVFELERVFGVHFFNPVNKMALVELCELSYSNSIYRDQIRKLLVSIQKEIVFVQDRPGYIVNRLLIPYIHNAILLMESKVAIKEEIDKAMKLGANHPIGPLKLADLIGLDVVLAIFKQLYPEGPISALLEEKVSNNQLGRKTGIGFYEYLKNPGN